jgi:hypothetical protein
VERDTARFQDHGNAFRLNPTRLFAFQPAEAPGEGYVDGLLARMSSRHLTEWMAYVAGKQRVDDLLRDGQGTLDPTLAWELVWGLPGSG